MAHCLLRSSNRRSGTATARAFLSYFSPPNSRPTDSAAISRSPLPLQSQSRITYISEMRKSAFEGNILRLLRSEIGYELERSAPSQEPASEFNGFSVDGRSGEQWIRLNRKFGDNEEIKVEVTMFDGSVPVKKTSSVATEDDSQLHITMIVNIFRMDGSDVLEFVCSAWPDRLEIQKLYVRKSDQIIGHPYMGPGFKELDDQLQDSLYDFLDARDINDELAEFLHEYMKIKDRSEFIRWMGCVKSFIEKK